MYSVLCSCITSMHVQNSPIKIILKTNEIHKPDKTVPAERKNIEDSIIIIIVIIFVSFCLVLFYFIVVFGFCGLFMQKMAKHCFCLNRCMFYRNHHTLHTQESIDVISSFQCSTLLKREHLCVHEKKNTEAI